jgi:hypothetical protein
MKAEPTLTAKRLRQLLHYNPKTGVFRWRVQKRGPIGVGRVAGTLLQANQHRVICINYRKYMASHLACLFMTGRWPNVEMDHKNCKPDDDRWSNLRPANHLQNMHNRSIRLRKNKHTPKGVSWHKPSNKYQVGITINSRWVALGYFDDPEAGHAAYVKAAKAHFGQFARAR